MRQLVMWTVALGTLLPVSAFAEPDDYCTYAGKNYSTGAFLCVAKNVGIICGSPVVLGTTSPFEPGAGPKKKYIGWQLVLQNNDLTHGNKGDACEGNPGATPQ